MPLYPLKFQPRFVPKIWGGRRLSDVLGKGLPVGESVGESWELYDFPAGVVENSTDWVSAVIANGPLQGRTLHSVVQEFGRELYGDVALVGDHGQFPILIKFLDAREDLSVQVHPDEAYAAANLNAHLKSEAWYILEHDAGASIYKGLVPGTTRDAFKVAIEDGSVMERIVRIPVEVGQCHYLPSGTVHALGAGVLVAEVQTPSDTTFRVFDFDRIDGSTQQPRELHIDQALACIDFGTAAGAPGSDVGGTLVQSPYFRIDKVHTSKGEERRLRHNQPSVWIILEGEFEIHGGGISEPTHLTRGETVLLPARMESSTLKANTDCHWLEVTFPINGDQRV